MFLYKDTLSEGRYIVIDNKFTYSRGGINLVNIGDYLLIENDIICSIFNGSDITELLTPIYVQLNNINDNKLTLTFY